MITRTLIRNLTNPAVESPLLSVPLLSWVLRSFTLLPPCLFSSILVIPPPSNFFTALMSYTIQQKYIEDFLNNLSDAGPV